MVLNILIATVVDRREMFLELQKELNRQIDLLENPMDVSIISIEDNKEISIGLKRQRLLEMATSKYIVYFDSDDYPYDSYVKDIIESTKLNPDCIGFNIHMTTNGKNPQVCCHSLRYKEWDVLVDGFDYVRGVTHFNPVKREIALQVGFKDIRFGEDKDYSDRITPICKTESYINKNLFHYRYSTEQNHKEKYGIK